MVLVTSLYRGDVGAGRVVAVVSSCNDVVVTGCSVVCVVLNDASLNQIYWIRAYGAIQVSLFRIFQIGVAREAFLVVLDQKFGFLLADRTLLDAFLGVLTNVVHHIVMAVLHVA